jgi:hypothetical protein
MPRARYDLQRQQIGVEAATVVKKAKLKAEASVYPMQAGSADAGRLKV